MGVDYVSNDILASELSQAPAHVSTALFGLGEGKGVGGRDGQFDLAFSRMLMEHLPDFRAAYRDISRLLRPGGVSIAFHPVLFAPPFLANRILPDRMSRFILKGLSPDRSDEGVPKFPAYYNGCTITSHLRHAIGEAGFSEVWQIPFFGHAYYRRIPIVRSVHALVRNGLSRFGPPWSASFVFTVARK
jgi:SAM-dependent methyltransferase